MLAVRLQYRQAPEHTMLTEKDFLDFLPPMDIAIKQWQIRHFLGSVRYTRFGFYEGDLFKDEAIKAAAAKFKADLERIEVDIKSRNHRARPMRCCCHR